MMGTKLRAFAPLGDRSLEELVPTDNSYRRLQRVLDLSFIHNLVADCYAAGGRPSVDPEVFFKLQLVMFLEGIRSERQLMRVVADRISVRWYLGYDLDEPLPDHSSLTHIRDRYGVEIFRRFFERIIERCVQAGLVWGRELFFDASKIEANALVASMGARFAIEAHLAARFPDDDAIAESEPPPPPPPLPLAQEVADDLAESNARRHDWLTQHGQQQRDVVGRDYRRIADYTASRTDPDASPMHVKGNAHPGYHLHYAIDGGKARIILAALVTPAEVMENMPMLDLLWHSRFRWHLWPHHVTGDTTYGTIENITAIEREGIRAYVSLPNYEQRTAYFPKSKFTYDPEWDVYICPQGEQLRRYSYSRTDRQIKYRADKKVCNRCPLKEQCTTGKAGRKVERSFDEEYVERVRGYQETEPYKKAIEKRKVWIEPLFGEAKDWHGMRRFRLRRLAKVNIEALVVASGQNIKRLLTMRRPGAFSGPGGAGAGALARPIPRAIAWAGTIIGGLNRGISTLCGPVPGFLNSLKSCTAR
jgi:transposase